MKKRDMRISIKNLRLLAFIKKIRLSLLPFKISFLSLTLSTALILFIYSLHGYEQIKNTLQIKEEASITIVKNYVEDSLTTVYSDLSYINEIILYNLDDLLHSDKERVEQNLLRFCSQKTVYDQIRFLHYNGDEVVRINKFENSALVVPQQLLQNKKKRPYFSSSISLPGGMVYMSPLDLNIENNLIEVPHKPMLRFATPVVDASGKTQGVVILNYLAHKFLKNLPYIDEEQANLCNHMLLNSDGYWLYCNGESKLQFRFMFPEQEQITFKKRYPQAYEQIYSKDEGFIYTDEGLFIWNTIFPQSVAKRYFNYSSNMISQDKDSYYWKNVSFLSIKRLDQIRLRVATETFRYFPLILLPLFILSLVIGQLVHSNREYQKHIRKLAHFDKLTQMHNRHFFLTMAHKTLKLTARKKEGAALLFIDLDGFKSINDTYGHKAGDMVLQEVAKRLTSVLRESDLTARFGGDEFLVMLYNIENRDYIAKVVSKIKETVAQTIYSKEWTFKVGCSVGSAFFPEDGESVHELIEHADSAMYQDKKSHCQKR